MSFDIEAFVQSGETKVPLENIKGRLYSRQTLDQRIQNHERPNSFVRPRMEF